MRFSGNSETPCALYLFYIYLCVTLSVLCLHGTDSYTLFERLSINGNSPDFGRLVEKIADWRLARADGVVPYYFVIEP